MCAVLVSTQALLIEEITPSTQRPIKLSLEGSLIKSINRIIGAKSIM